MPISSVDHLDFTPQTYRMALAEAATTLITPVESIDKDKMPFALSNLMTSNIVLSNDGKHKFIRVSREDNSNTDKTFHFHDDANQLISNSRLLQGSFSKSVKCTLQKGIGNLTEDMNFTAESRLCCNNSRYKLANLRNQTNTPIGTLDMTLPVVIYENAAIDQRTAITVRDNVGREIFKVRMISGFSELKRRGIRKLERSNDVPHVFDVLSAAFGQNSLGKITKPVNDESSSRDYTFEYMLPLDPQVLSIILCCIMALETCYRDAEIEERLIKYESRIIMSVVLVILLIVGTVALVKFINFKHGQDVAKSTNSTGLSNP